MMYSYTTQDWKWKDSNPKKKAQLLSMKSQKVQKVLRQPALKLYSNANCPNLSFYVPFSL